MLRDDFSGFVWLYPFAEADAQNTADAIIDWSASFTAPSALISDSGAHFKNETVRLVTKGLRVPHHFTLPYTPWSNGGIERMGKEVLRVFRVVCSELRMDANEWPGLVPVLQSALNNAPSPQRKNYAPVTIFTCMTPSSPVSVFLLAFNGDIMSISDAQRERTLNIDGMQRVLNEMHPLVEQSLMKNRELARAAQSRGQLPNFAIGDFVLIAKDTFKSGEKLSLRWSGPRRIVGASRNHIYKVEDIRNGEKEDMHACRLRFFSNKDLNTEAVFPHVLYSERGMPVQRLMELTEAPDGIYIRVRWRGLPPADDTLEPLCRDYEDAPQLVKKLLGRKATPRALANKAKAVLDLS